MKRIAALFALTLSVLVVSCSRTSNRADSSSRTGLVLHDSSTTARYAALGDSGYRALDAGDTTTAIAAFTAQNDLVTGSHEGAYNLACAYGRFGRVDPAIAWLTKSIDSGLDDTATLESDGDLASVRTDPRFAALLARAKANAAAHGAAFAEGLPRYANPPVAIPDADSLERWTRVSSQAIRRNRRIWFDWQTTQAQLDFEAQRLAAERALDKTGGFDEGIERVRAISSIRSTWEPWGPLSDGVLKEVNAYLPAAKDPEKIAEAHYHAGVAAFCRTLPSDAGDSTWAAAATPARAEFKQVPEGTKFAGGAAAWLLAMDLAEARDSRATLAPRVKEFAEKYRGDEVAMSVTGEFFQKDVIAALWPIPLEATDIDGKPVSIADFKGKVLLVDFWATWCGPCRAELPGIVTAYQKYHPQGLEILSVSLDYPERTTVDALRSWTAAHGMTWHHVYERKGWSSAYAQTFLVRSIPNPILVGRDGSLSAMGEDCLGASLPRSIEAALKKPAAS